MCFVFLFFFFRLGFCINVHYVDYVERKKGGRKKDGWRKRGFDLGLVMVFKLFRNSHPKQWFFFKMYFSIIVDKQYNISVRCTT